MNWFQQAKAASVARIGAVVERLRPAIPPIRRPPKAGEVLFGEQTLATQMQRIGGQLTPRQLSNILRAADTGRIALLMDLANEARQKDTHLHSVIQTRELAVAGLPWQVVPPPNANRRERKAAEQVAEALSLSADVNAMITHMAGACYQGLAVCETIWHKADGVLYPASFLRLQARRFEYDLATGRLLWADPGQEPVDIRKDYPAKFVVHQPRITGDIPCREGLVRVLMWAALFRNWTLGDWLRLGELSWKPWRIGYYEKGASDEDIAALDKTLYSLATEGVARLPDGTRIDITTAKAGTSGSGRGTHNELFSVIGAEMSKAVLGQTLSTEQGDRGSQALGTVQERVRYDILEADAKSVSAAITRDVVQAMTWLNHGRTVRPGRFVLITDDTADLKSFGDGLKAVREAGVKRIPAAWARDRAGIPEAKEGEETLDDADTEAAAESKGSSDNKDKAHA